MEVIVVNIDDFHRFFIIQCIWNRPAIDGSLFEIDRALVVRMVQLGESFAKFYWSPDVMVCKTKRAPVYS